MGSRTNTGSGVVELVVETQESIEVCDVNACPEFNGQSSQAGLVVGNVQNAVKPLFVSESSDLNAILI